MRRLLSWYLHHLHHRPVLTKSLTSALVGASGDMIQQTLEQRDRLSLYFIYRHDSFDDIAAGSTSTPPLQYDVSRLLRQASFGLLIVGPMCHQWMKVLDIMVMASTPIRSAVMKTAVDQVTMAPFSTAVFFTYMALAEGKSHQQCRQTVATKTWPTLLINWQIWPAAVLFNMYFVPLPLRVLFLNTVGLGYSVVLSSIANSDSSNKSTTT